jgi:alpha,alpha-trehalase
MLPVILFMSIILSTYFETKEYQEVCYIIQFVVYKDVDSKLFADKKLRYDIKVIHSKLMDLIHRYHEDISDVVKINDPKLKSDLVKFVDDNFVDEDELLSVPFLKLVDLPDFVRTLDGRIKDVFENVHNLWYKYARKDAENDDGFYTVDPESGNTIMNKVGYKNDNKLISNKIHLPNIYFVPGGRFRELYYWDCNWILLGLLSCNMHDVSYELVLSLTYLIDKYGYIPNGSRKYYLGRSQPPMYAQMLFRLYKGGIQREWVLSKGLETLEKEYTWWMDNRSFDKGLRLNRYKVDQVNHPRPESFKEDFYLKGKYFDLWSGAESGWDFSKRWFDKDDIGGINTGDIIPVDLNVYILIMERIIQKFYKIKLKSLIGDNEEVKDGSIFVDTDKKIPDKKHIEINSDTKEIYENKIVEYGKYIIQREEDINKVLWNKSQNMWNDYNTKTKMFTDSHFYFSNITPLFLKLKIPGNLNLYDIINKYKKELFGYPGGIPASGAENGGHQWDFPNVWAPLVQMFIEYIYDIEPEMGLHVARSFFSSVYKGMGTNKQFHEKYDCVRVGVNGKGGEYNPQEGFGWTNGTVAWIIKVFGNDLIKERKHDESYEKICEIIDKRKTKLLDD